MARMALGLGVRELAELAKVSPDTIARLERGDLLKERTVENIRSALEAAGVDFIPENGGGAGVRLRKRMSAVTEGVEMKIGDLVSYREDRPGSDLRKLGKIGRIIDPGHKPPFPTHVCVEFDGDGGTWVDKGMLAHLALGKSGA